MQDDNQEVLAKLRTFKQQGLSFYQASEQLKQQGYTPAQITDAANSFNYNSPAEADAAGSAPDQLSTATSAPVTQRNNQLDKDYQKLGDALLQDRERGRRWIVYVFIPMSFGALVSQNVQLLVLVKHGLGAEVHFKYSWYNVALYVAGTVFATICLKLHFRSTDKRYERINRQTSDEP